VQSSEILTKQPSISEREPQQLASQDQVSIVIYHLHCRCNTPKRISLPYDACVSAAYAIMRCLESCSCIGIEMAIVAMEYE